MVSFEQLWLPMLLSAVFVFFASSILNMVLRFWHAPDYKRFSNEGEISVAMRKGNPGPGMYMLPYCTPETMKTPETQEMFKLGPLGMVALRKPGSMNMGASLAQWFAFCLLVSFGCAALATPVLSVAANSHVVFHTVAVAALMAYGFGSVPNSIWWGHPWITTIKHAIDGLIYALITAATFVWLWPK